MRKKSQTGSYAPNPHEGKRSEYLALYFFSSLGTAVPIPTAEDAGLDLHCTIADRLGQRAWPRCFYTVQVKSDLKPWSFEGEESVRWISAHQFPVFLCVVEKKQGRFRLYQTLGRHHLQAHPPLPARVELEPEDGAEGTVFQWNWEKNKAKIQLSAPILDFTLEKFLDDSFTTLAKDVISEWVKWDNANSHRRSSGIFQVEVPSSYKSNERLAQPGTASGGAIFVGEGLRPAIENLKQSLEWTAGCLSWKGDKSLAVRMLLLIRRLEGNPFLVGAIPLLKELCRHLGFPGPISNQTRLDDYFAGLDKIDEEIEKMLPEAWRR